MRLNCVDHYQANPSELDPPLPHKTGNREKSYKPKVPVVRIFGTTETGQKICVHVHGAFPYLYVRYDGDLNPETGSSRKLPHCASPTKVIFSTVCGKESAYFNRSCPGSQLPT